MAEPVDKYGLYPPAVRAKMRESLIIGISSSECGNCGRQTLPEGDTHEKLSGYGPQNGEPGCQAKWKYVTTSYHGPGIEVRVASMRPDLEFWSMTCELDKAAVKEANIDRED